MFQTIHSRSRVMVFRARLPGGVFPWTEFSRNLTTTKVMQRQVDPLKIEFEKPDVIPTLLQKPATAKDKKVNLMEQTKKYPFVKAFLFEDIKKDKIKQAWPYLKEYAAQCGKTLQVTEKQFRFLRQKYELSELFNDHPEMEKNDFLMKIQRDFRDPITKQNIVKTLSDKQFDAVQRTLKHELAQDALSRKAADLSPIAKKKWNEWIKFSFLSLGHPMIAELHEMLIQKPEMELSKEIFDCVLKYAFALSKVNFQPPAIEDTQQKRNPLSRFLILKSRLKMTCDWEGLHKNTTLKKLSEHDPSVSPLTVFQFQSVNEFLEECAPYFERCVQFQNCWDASEEKLRSRYFETKEEQKETPENEESGERKKDPFLDFIKFFAGKMNNKDEILFPYLWDRAVNERNIEGDEFADRIWNRWRIDNDEDYPNRAMVMLALFEAASNEKSDLLKSRLLSGEPMTDDLKNELDTIVRS